MLPFTTLLLACARTPAPPAGDSSASVDTTTWDSADTDTNPIDTDIDTPPDTETDSDIAPADTARAWTDPECVVDPSEPVWIWNGEAGISSYKYTYETCMTYGNGVLIDKRYWEHRFWFFGGECVYVGCDDVEFYNYGYIERDDGVILFLSNWCVGDVRDPAFLDDQGRVREPPLPPPPHCP